MKAYKIISTIGSWIWRPKKQQYLCQMKAKFADKNEVIEADSNISLVTKMRELSFTSDKTNREYMMGYAQRAVLSKNEDIRATNEDDFITDLIKHRHMELV